MNESKFLGALIPASPNFAPIIKTVREKYSLPDLSPKDDPITEIYLGDDIISLEEFRRDIRSQILENLEQSISEQFSKQYQTAKKSLEYDYQKDLEKIPDELKPNMKVMFDFLLQNMQALYQILDAQIDKMANMVYYNLLTGDTLAAPDEWFGIVTTSTISGEQTILAMANEITNLDTFCQEIRDLHKKTFGVRHVKFTDKTVDSAYYLQLKKNKKPTNFIVEEYIKRNNFKLPRRNSDRYIQVWNKYAERLKKRLQKTQKILDAMVRE